jgi:O-antigen/teichoic acid export membrane protein
MRLPCAYTELVKSLAKFSSFQVVIQAIGFICGLIVVRLLAPEQYALYTLANAMLGTLTILADSGVSAGALAQGGKVWQSREKLGAVMVTSMQLRRRFAVISIAITMPILGYLLMHHGATWLDAGAITVLVVVSFQITFTNILYEIAAQLHQNVSIVGKVRTETGLLRLFALLSTISAWPYSAVALAASGLPQLYASRSLRIQSEKMVDWSQKVDPHVKEETLRIVRRVMPNSIFYCINSQIVIYLISIFGTTVNVAELGALGRITQVFSILLVVFNVVLLPRFARLRNRDGLLSYFVRSMLGLFFTATLLAGVVAVLSNKLVVILGVSYQGLGPELTLAAIGALIGLLSKATQGMGNARGWVVNPIILIGISVTAQVCLIFFLDVSTLRGVLIFAMGAAAAPVMVRTPYLVYRAVQDAKAVA